MQGIIHANGGGTTLTADWPTGTTTGNLLVMVIGFVGGSLVTPSTPTGWTRIGSVIDNGTNVGIAIYYIENSASRSGTETLTISPAAVGTMCLLEYSGIKSASALDTNNSITGNSSGPSTGSITNQPGDSLLIGVTAVFVATVLEYNIQSNPTNSFIIRKQSLAGTGTNDIDLAIEERIVASSSSYDTQTTLSETHQWAGLIVAFIGAPVALSPVAGSLTLTGKTPSSMQANVLTPGNDSLTISGLQGSISRGTGQVPDAGSIALTGLVPTIGTVFVLTPSVGSLVLTGFAPSLSFGTVLIPSAGSLALTGLAPSISVSSVLTPASGTLTLTGFSPSFVKSTLGQPFAGTLILTPFAPSASQSAVRVPGAGTLTITGQAPGRIAGAVRVPGVASLVLTGKQPSVASGPMLTPGTGTLTLTGQIPGTDTATKNLTPFAGSLTLTPFAPTSVVASPALSPGTASLILTGYQPGSRVYETRRRVSTCAI